MALRPVPGVTDAHVDWRTGRAVVRHAAGLRVAELIGVIEAAAEGTRHIYRARLVAPQAVEGDGE